MGLPLYCGIPSKVARIMELLRWADFPHCKPLADYEGDANLYRNLKRKVRLGKRVAEAMRRGP